ncbi:MAG: hypothetical protein H7281_15580 [Bacteriovorax sp.]|nr:hypothetical protein [Bacteriovorax sp.]
MKSFLLMSLFFILFQNISAASTLQWSDLEIKGHYVLDQKVSFPGVAEFEKGDKVDVLNFIPGLGNIMYYQVHLVNCKKPKLESDMILINPTPQDSSRDRSVGVQLEAGCNIAIFLEPIDFYSPSLFSDI